MNYSCLLAKYFIETKCKSLCMQLQLIMSRQITMLKLVRGFGSSTDLNKEK